MLKITLLKNPGFSEKIDLIPKISSQINRNNFSKALSVNLETKYPLDIVCLLAGAEARSVHRTLVLIYLQIA